MLDWGANHLASCPNARKEPRAELVRVVSQRRRGRTKTYPENRKCENETQRSEKAAENADVNCGGEKRSPIAIQEWVETRQKNQSPECVV